MSGWEHSILTSSGCLLDPELDVKLSQILPCQNRPGVYPQVLMFKLLLEICSVETKCSCVPNCSCSRICCLWKKCWIWNTNTRGAGQQWERRLCSLQYQIEQTDYAHCAQTPLVLQHMRLFKPHVYERFGLPLSALPQETQASTHRRLTEPRAGQHTCEDIIDCWLYVFYRWQLKAFKSLKRQHLKYKIFLKMWATEPDSLQFEERNRSF